jgi:uncharacterized protein
MHRAETFTEERERGRRKAKPCLALLLILGNANGSLQAMDGRITESIHSTVLGEDRSIIVQLPSSLAPGKRIPVVYVLDAEANFDTVVQVLQGLGQHRAAASSMVVVGVGNIWSRYRDYTPTRIAASPHVDPQTAATTGGGRKFISFLKTELIPHVERKYSVSSTRILVGHSIGGLIGMEILVNHRGLFTHYVAIDPSMWWDEGRLLTEAQRHFRSDDFGKRSLYLAIANVNAKNLDMQQVRSDRSAKSELNRPVVALADQLSAISPKGLSFEYKFYEDEDHMSVVLPGVRDGLKFVLESLAQP